MAVSPNFAIDQTVFVGTEAVDGFNHLLKSTDGGATFQPASSGIPVTDVQDIAISPNFSADGTVYAATGGDGFFISNDRGESWQPFMNGLTCSWSSIIVLSPNYLKDQTIYSGMRSCGESGVWKYAVISVVSIDIKPGSFPNSINLGSGGMVPVAILSTTTFDATTVDPTTVTLASAPVMLKRKGLPMASFQDVNGDGRLDLVVHATTEALQLSETDTEATLNGQTFDGTPISGVDSVRIVP